MIGYPPKVLTNFNSVELALISPVRTEKHIFSFSAGARKEVRGWHTMYANNVTYMNRVINYFEERRTQLDEVIEIDDQSEDGDVSTRRID